MLCYVYRSSKKEQTYLYVNKRDDFSDIPDALMSVFGTPSLVTTINLVSQKKLALADLSLVKSELAENGFYLQLPPPKEDLLKEHKAQLQSSADSSSNS